MPTTRSATKKHADLEKPAEDGPSGVRKSSTKGRGSSGPSHKVKENEVHTEKSNKRKPTETVDSSTAPSTKKSKQQRLSSAGMDKLEGPIMINRAPVLQLWGAVVAQFLHPNLAWPACLSIGNAISTFCAISKGRAVGMIDPKDAEKPDDRKEQKEKSQENAEAISVMGFQLHLKDNAVIVSGKPKSFSEEALQSKFGAEHYKATKKTMLDVVQSWSENKDELDKNAFHMYERFRPNVATGRKGWGRKGELSLHEVASVIGTP